MNVFLFEIKNNRKFAIIWALSILLIIVITIAFYPMIKNDMKLFIDVMKNYPPALKKAFGMDFERANSIVGYFATMPYTFLMICASFEAMLLGINIISIESISKTADFIFTKPISRFKLFISKISASFTLLMLTDLFLLLSTYLILNIFDQVNLKAYLLLFGSVILLQIIFLTFGVLVATILPKVKSPVSISLSIVFGIYAFTSFADDKMRILIPFKYFNSTYILENNKYEVKYVLLSILLIILFSFISKIKYIKKDIHSV